MQAEFKTGSLQNDPRSGRPATTTREENIDHVHDMLMDDNNSGYEQLLNSGDDEDVCRPLQNRLLISNVDFRRNVTNKVVICYRGQFSNFKYFTLTTCLRD